MSRPLRIEYQDAWYHVMNHGRRGEQIFSDEKDYRQFLAILKDAVELWKINICGYCLMPNHYHLLLQTPDANLSRCMRHINGVYTQRYNRQHQLDGPLFRGRFKSILIGDETYLVELLRYLCFNPVNEGLVSHPADYPWSCYNDYQITKKQTDWLNRDLIIQRFKKNEGKRKTKADLLAKDATDDLYTLLNKKNLPSFLGSRAFIDQMRARFFEQMVHPEKPAGKELAVEPKMILTLIRKYFSVTKKAILSPKRGTTNTPRDVAIYLSRTQAKLNLEKIARIFHFSNYSGVSSAIERVKGRLKREPALLKAIKELEGQLTMTTKRQKKT